MTLLEYQKECRKRRRNCSSADIAIKLHKAGSLERNPAELEKTVDYMLNAGSHYKNLEMNLGTAGIALVLGTRTSKTLWTKALNKSGKEFDNVITHLKAVQLPEHAKRFAKLEKILIDYKIKILLGEAQDTYLVDLEHCGGSLSFNPGQVFPPMTSQMPSLEG